MPNMRFVEADESFGSLKIAEAAVKSVASALASSSSGFGSAAGAVQSAVQSVASALASSGGFGAAADAGHRKLVEGGIYGGVGVLVDPVNMFLVQTVIIMSICRCVGLFCSLVKQPQVIGEIVGGIILGPSGIGQNKKYIDLIFPTASLNYLSMVANIGLILYLFIVGLELDPALLMTHARKSGGVAMAGMIIPFCLGIAISATLQENLQGDDPKFKDVKPEAFLVFIGTAMSITAFPVLARILKEGGLIYTVSGSMAMGAAALDDAMAWCLLILSLSIANASNLSSAAWAFLSTVAFAVGLIVIVRPVFFRLVHEVESWHSAKWNNYVYALTLILVFMCSWITSLLGVHYIFGPFLFGLIVVPRDSHLFVQCNESIEEIVVTFTLPLFFALSGIRTDITQIRGQDTGMVFLVCAIATIGKFVGAGSVSYFSGLPARESVVVAVLMNTRGLVELIVLNLGLQVGILNTRTFSVMVLMCLFTTFVTSPVIEYIYPPHLRIMSASKGASSAAARFARSKSISVKHGRDDEEQANGGSGVDSDSAISFDEIVFNLEEMLVHVQLGVVVDRVEHLSGLMRIVNLFAPLYPSSSLEVTGMHFHEPSLLANRDEFVALNEENKLLVVEKEATTVDVTHSHHSHGRAVYVNEASMLPLSMFVKAIGGAASAFRIKGDPENFSAALHAKAVEFDFNVILFPWRPSAFVEQLLWRSLELVASPVALFVQTNLAPGSGAGSFPPSTSTKASAYASSSSSSKEKAKDSAAADSPEPATRGRSMSSASPYAAIVPSPEASVSDVLVVITGAPCDSLLLPFALRAAGNPNLQVTVCICASAKAGEESGGMVFSPSLVAAIDSFRSRIRSMRNLNVILETIDTVGADVDELMAKFESGPRFDLIVVGFSIVSDAEADAAAAAAAASASASAVRKMSIESGDSTVPSTAHNSTRFSTANIIGHGLFNSGATSEAERRVNLGIPSRYAESSLAHLELGSLGSRLFNAKLSPYLLVYHEPKADSRLGVDATPFDLSSAPKGKHLSTIVEEDNNAADPRFVSIEPSGKLKKGTDSDSER